MISMMSTESRDYIDDLVNRLICHGGFIDGGFADRGCIDALHRPFVFLHIQFLPGFFPGHNSARAVGSGIIPIRISPADCQDAAVPHIDGDQDLFALMGGDGPLPQNPLF